MLVPFTALADSIRTVGSLFLDVGQDTSFKETRDAVNNMMSAFDDNGLDTFIAGLDNIAVTGELAMEKMIAGGEKAKVSIAGATTQVKELSFAQEQAISVADKLAQSLIQAASNSGSVYKLASEQAKTSLDEQLSNIAYLDEVRGASTRDSLDQQSQAYSEYFSELSAQRDLQFESDQNALVLALENKKITEEQYLIAKNQLEKQYAADSLKQQKEQQDAYRKNKLAQLRLDEQYYQATSKAMGDFGSLMQAHDKGLFETGKAFSIAQATMDTYAAANKALATLPPPLSFISAAASVTAGLMNVAKISCKSLDLI